MATLTFRPLGPARTATVVGLLVGAAGAVVLGFAAAPMPLAVVALVVAAVLVGATRGWWTPLFAALVGLAEVLWFVLSGSAAGLLALDEPLWLAGSWLRGTGVVLALVAGVVAMREGASSRDGHRTR